MRTVKRCLIGLILAGLLTGCSQDRESALVGEWGASSTSALGMAAQMKQQDPSASSSDVMAASRQLRATGIDIRPDKTFQLSWAGQVMSGDWTFDKESGELLLNINKTEDLEGNPVEQAAQTWAAYLEPTNDRLRLYPVPKEAMELMKSSDSALAKGIALTKNPD